MGTQPLLHRINAAAVAALRALDMQARWQSMALTVEAGSWPGYLQRESKKSGDFVRLRTIGVQ